MSNQHTKNDIALNYMKTVLNWPEKVCPKNRCKSAMIPVSVRYADNGPTHNEWECCECGKVLRDPTKRRYNNRKGWRKGSGQGYNKNRGKKPEVKNDSNSRQSRSQ